MKYPVTEFLSDTKNWKENVIFNFHKFARNLKMMCNYTMSRTYIMIYWNVQLHYICPQASLSRIYSQNLFSMHPRCYFGFQVCQFHEARVMFRFLRKLKTKSFNFQFSNQGKPSRSWMWLRNLKQNRWLPISFSFFYIQIAEDRKIRKLFNHSEIE